MRNDNTVKKALIEALVTYDKFKKYCLEYGIKLSNIKACILGQHHLVNLTKDSIDRITWLSRGRIDTVLLKFKCDRENALDIEEKFGAYQVKLSQFKLNFLKSKVKDTYIEDIKKWAKDNNVNFFVSSQNHSQNDFVKKVDEITKQYPCKVFVSDNNESRGVSIGKHLGKFKVKKWHLNHRGEDDADVLKEFEDINEVFKYLYSWIKSEEIKNIKSNKETSMKVFAYKGKIITASSKQEAITKIIASRGAPLELRNDESRIPKEITNEASVKKFIEQKLRKIFSGLKIDSIKVTTGKKYAIILRGIAGNEYNDKAVSKVMDLISNSYGLEYDGSRTLFIGRSLGYLNSGDMRKKIKIISSLKKHFKDLSIAIEYPDYDVRSMLREVERNKGIEKDNKEIRRIYNSIKDVKKHLSNNIHDYADVCIVLKSVNYDISEYLDSEDITVYLCGKYNVGKDTWLLIEDVIECSDFEIILDDLITKFGKENVEVFFELR